MGKIIKLIFVEGIGKNSNKFYNMSENSDGTFSVEYGRVDSTSQKTSYPMSQWSKKYNEKLKKGYKDITELYKIEDEVLTESKIIASESIDEISFMLALKNFAKNMLAL